MNIVITGSNSGVGLGLTEALCSLGHNVVPLTRGELDLSDINQVTQYNFPTCDLLINCAGTGVGGKTDFVKHSAQEISDILNVNLVSPTLLSHKALSLNQQCKIVNVTSTNNNRYWPNDLAYSLSKKGLEEFGNMLRVEYPGINYLEIRLGLTKTNFNQNRYHNHQDRFADIYASSKHLTVEDVVNQIISILFNNNVKFIEISP